MPSLIWLIKAVTGAFFSMILVSERGFSLYQLSRHLSSLLCWYISIRVWLKGMNDERCPELESRIEKISKNSNQPRHHTVTLPLHNNVGFVHTKNGDLCYFYICTFYWRAPACAVFICSTALCTLRGHLCTESVTIVLGCVQCAVHSVHCALCTVHCLVCSVQCAACW